MATKREKGVCVRWWGGSSEVLGEKKKKITTRNIKIIKSKISFVNVVD